MQYDFSHFEDHPYFCTAKVHRLLCLELKKFVDKIVQIFAAIESARPRCQSGIQTLCSLHVCMEKAMLLLQHCSESSKLYLTITADKILLRCEKLRYNMESCLRQIQKMVPSNLADQLSSIVDELQSATFTLESSEYEVGKILLGLLHQDIAASRSTIPEELEAFKFAALRLHITSAVDVLIEKRSIKKLLGKIQDTDPTKKKILNYFLYLLRKYGKPVGPESYIEKERGESLTEVLDSIQLPEVFICPLSMRLMSDPVTIDSGQTFERLWIEKWFNDGNRKCPRTCKILTDLSTTPNCTLKDMILDWWMKNGITYSLIPLHKFSACSTVASFGSSLDHLQLQTSNISFGSTDTSSGLCSLIADSEDEVRCDFQKTNYGINLSFVAKLSSLPWTSRRNIVEDLKTQLEEQKGSHLVSASYIEPLVEFLKDAQQIRDIGAQKNGAQLLLMVLRECRSEAEHLPKDAFYVLSSLFDSGITTEVLAIMEELASQPCYETEIVASGVLSSILGLLEDPASKYHLAAIRVLCTLSSHSRIRHHMIYLDYITKMVPFLDDLVLAGYCIKIFNNLCSIEEATRKLTETENCITSIGELLEAGTDEEQELAIDVLLLICHQGEDFCELVRKEITISSLVEILTTGNSQVKVVAEELLQLLNSGIGSHSQECTSFDTGMSAEISVNMTKRIRKNKSPCKLFRLFGRGKS